MNKHKATQTILNITTLAVALTAWVSSIGSSVSPLDLASLLGVTAFSLMWVHYVTDAFAPKDESDSSLDMQYKVSRIVVLFAIISHPFLVNYYLITNGFGFPPGSYQKLLGDFALVTLLGYSALAAFLLFEVRQKIRRFDSFIFHANITAMFLVLIHGFLIGMVLLNTWFAWVWWAYLIVFAGVAIKRYNEYYTTNLTKKIIAISLVLALTIVGGIAGVRAVSQPHNSSTHDAMQSSTINSSKASNSTTTTDTTNAITLEQLAANNGLDGNKCWIAIDGTVYDPSSSNQWRNGEHIPSNGMAKCGRDLTNVISQSPHGKEVLGKIQVVGKLAQ